jgi:hypothetical protein
MNAFVRHHAPHIAFRYQCFDRLLLNGYIPNLLFPGCAASFLRHRRNADPPSPAFLRRIANDYHAWLQARADQLALPIRTPPPGVRRHDWVEPFYRELGDAPGLAALLKCREPSRLIASDPHQGYHLQRLTRHVYVYYLYLRDAQLGRLFLRICPYFPFDLQVCVNGHQWLAQQLTAAGIGFARRDNVLVACDDPERLQALADAFGPAAINAAVLPLAQQWLSFFTPQEQAQGYRHRLYVAQAEYCDNLVFHRAAALDRLFSRLLDANRAIGQPDRLAAIFGSASWRPQLGATWTEVKAHPGKLTVIKTGFAATSVKQYVKDATVLRTETTCQRLKDLALPKDLQKLPRVRQVLRASNERYQEAQQDVLISSVDRGQLQQLQQPTTSAAGRRTPGLRLTDLRLLAVLTALTRFVYLIGGRFRTKDLLTDVRDTLGRAEYHAAQLRYDLGKLRGKGLVQRVRGTQQYELSRAGYQVAVLYQKLYHRLYAPLTAAVLAPQRTDNGVLTRRQGQLDRCYQAVDKALRALSEQAGIAA